MILFFGGGPSQLPWIVALRRVVGPEPIIVVDRNGDCPGRDLADTFVRASIWDADAVLRALPPACAPRAVVTNTGGPTAVALGQVAARVGAPTYASVAGQAACYKSIFRREANLLLRQEHEALVLTEAEWDWELVARRFPDGVFLKPDVSRVGKAACRVVADPLRQRLAAPPSSASLNGRWVCEHYQPGGLDLIAVHLVREGTVQHFDVVEELNAHGRGVRNVGFRSCDDIGPTTREQLREASHRLIEGLAIEQGPVAVSFRVRQGAIYPVELHLDFGGENIYLLGAHGTPEDVLRSALGDAEGGAQGRPSARPDPAPASCRWSIYGAAIDRLTPLLQADGTPVQRTHASTDRVQHRFSTDYGRVANVKQALGLEREAG